MPFQFLGLLHIGTRMTVVQLDNGELLLHSPVPLSAELHAAIDAIGEVRHIICPNLFHHVYAGEVAAAYPQAQLYGPAKLHRKRKDLNFAGVFSEHAPGPWHDELQAITIDGSLLHETVLYHARSRTLITSDLVENFKASPHPLTRWYLRAGGLLGNIGWHPLLRVVYVKRKAARASVERILALPFERVIIAHGEIIDSDARDSLRRGLQWL